MREHPQARRGYSRDQRPDCKQVVIGLVLDREGFPKAHEAFDGNRQGQSSVDEMLQALEQRTGRKGRGTVIVDRGMAFDEKLQQIQARGHHYVVACRQSERLQWLDDLEQEQGWQKVLRECSPTNPAQKKSQVWVKRLETADHLYILCRSEGRQAKDRAIREKQEKRLLADLDRLQARVAKKRLVEAQVYEAIGRLKERYPRVARYYRLSFDPGPGS
jgi:transposase